MKDRKHIGDAVFVSYDGYYIWLAVNVPSNKVVALEPQVMKQLIKYAESIKDKIEE